MDQQQRLDEAILKGDTHSFLSLIQENENIIDETMESMNTILHLAARLGKVELAKEIVKLRPRMVSAVNEKMETPLHDACREGWLEMVKLLVEMDRWVVYNVNRDKKSAFLVACERGKLDVVKYFLNYHLLTSELDGPTTSLHAAASLGNTEIVKEILKNRPDFARRKDHLGHTPLHLSCSKGHLQITRDLLRLDPSLCCLQDLDGQTPLHAAAARGLINIINEMLEVNTECADITTIFDETALHLAVKYNRYKAVRYMMNSKNIANLLNKPDRDGNTVLHIAVMEKLTAMVNYLLEKNVDLNAINCKGQTALDIARISESSGLTTIVLLLQEAGAENGNEFLIVPPPEIQQTEQSKSINLLPTLPEEMQVEVPITDHRQKQPQIQDEGVRNARKTITVVAVLISTVTFAAGINPPGGFNQQTGESLLGKRTTFKVFIVFNNLALFLSLGIVIFLVGIFPFRRKSLVNLLLVTYKVMWLSTSCMAVAFICAMWTILPHGPEGNWVLVAVVGIGGGCTLVIFVGSGYLLVKLWHKKLQWRMARKRTDIEMPREEEDDDEDEYEDDENSDFDSSDVQSYSFY